MAEEGISPVISLEELRRRAAEVRARGERPPTRGEAPVQGTVTQSLGGLKEKLDKSEPVEAPPGETPPARFNEFGEIIEEK